jgi:hypothetical protein
MNDDDNDKFDIEAWRKNAEAKPNIETRVGPTTDDDEVQPLVGEVLPLDQEVADQEENNGENDRDEGWREAAHADLGNEAGAERRTAARADERGHHRPRWQDPAAIRAGARSASEEA